MDIDTVTEFVPARGVAWREGDAWLGGGTWLFSQPQPELRRLLDLTDFGWRPLTETRRGLEIAATCTLAELAGWSPDNDWPAASLARQCCHALLGSFKIWNTATVGGNICLSLPAGPMTALAASLRCRTAFRQVSLSPAGRLAALVIGRHRPGAETVVTITASAPHPVQLRFAAPPEPAGAVRALDAAGLTYLDDVHGSARWREAMTRRAVAGAVAELRQ